DEAVALHDEEEVARAERLAGGDDAIEQRVQVDAGIPKLAPGDLARLAEHLRVLGSEYRDIGVVVEGDEFGPPEEDDLRLRSQQMGHRAAQALRPMLRRPERRL